MPELFGEEGWENIMFKEDKRMTDLLEGVLKKAAFYHPSALAYNSTMLRVFRDLNLKYDKDIIKLLAYTVMKNKKPASKV